MSLPSINMLKIFLVIAFRVCCLLIVVIFLSIGNYSCTTKSENPKKEFNQIEKINISAKIIPEDEIDPPTKYTLPEPIKTFLDDPTRIEKIVQPTEKVLEREVSFSLKNKIILDGSHPNYPIQAEILAKPTKAKRPIRHKAKNMYAEVKSNIFSLDDKSGLPTLHNNGIFQDNDGAIWGCSRWGGAWKYDGTQFYHYTEESGLPDYSVVNMFFDSDGDVWFGMSIGVIRYDGSSFINYSENSQISKLKPTKIIEDKHSNIWVGSHEGLYRIDKKNGTITSFNEENGLLKDEVNAIFYDEQDRLWVLYNNFGFSLIEIDKIDKEYTYNLSNYIVDKKNMFHNVQCVIQNDEGQIFIGNNLELILINNIDNDTEKPILAYSYRLEEHKDIFVFSMAIDHNGNLFTGSQFGLHQIVLNKSGRVKYAFPIKEMSYEAALAITVDKDNFLWVSFMNKNISRINLNKPFRKIGDEYGIKGNVTSIVKDDRGNLWFLSSRGKLYCLMNPTHPTREYLLDYTNVMNLNSTLWPNKLLYDQERNLWITQGTELIKLKLENNEGQILKYHYDFNKTISIFGIVNIMEDHQGGIWLSDNSLDLSDKILVSKGGGAYKIEGNSIYKYGKEQGLINNDTYSVCQDRDDNFWFNSVFYGLVKYEPDHSGGVGKWIHYEGENIQKKSFSIEPHANDGVYITSIKGLLHIPSKVDTPTQIGYMPLSSLDIPFSKDLESLSLSTSDDIWVSHRSGLFRVSYDLKNSDEAKIVVNTYSEEDGFPISSNPSTTILANDNDVFVGSQERLISIDLNEISKNNNVKEVVLQKIKLFDQDINWEKDTSISLKNQKRVIGLNYDSLSPWQYYPENLSLSYGNNYLSFEYNVVEVDQPHRVEYRSYLAGFEPSWNRPTSDAHTNYPNLPHGSYTFKVQSRISLGKWSETVSYPFTIRPPWWHTFWAYAVYLLILACLLKAMYGYFLNRNLADAESKRLMELDQLKTRLYANITHEFRTPLTVISGMNSQMKEDPEKWFDSGTSMIERNVNRLLGLVNQMLDLSKLESGKVSLNNEQGDVIVFLKYIAESVHSLAKSKQIQMHFHSEDENVIMDFDREKLQQVITNLISNAIKFTPPGGNVYILVRILKLNGNVEEKRWLQINVKDTGIGIPEDQLHNVFNRFYQVDDSNTRSTEGSGIGLALTRELILKMAGEISVKSKVNKETEFRILLPITNVAKMTSFDTGTTENTNIENLDSVNSKERLVNEKYVLHEESLSTNSTSKPQILIIEDNHDVVAYLVSCLEDSYSIKVGNNGQEGIDIAVECIPDLIITDVMMPLKDGFEVCLQLKGNEHTSHIPIIMVTAKSDMESKLEGLDKGADAYLSKPFLKKELLVRINSLLENRLILQKYFLSKAIDRSENIVEVDAPQLAAIDQKFINRLKEILEVNFFNPDFSVDQLNREMRMSKSQLHRKVTAMIGMSPNKYIRNVRLSKAKRLLIESDDTIMVISLNVGYADASYFGRLFKKEFGMTPNEWRNKNSN